MRSCNSVDTSKQCHAGQTSDVQPVVGLSGAGGAMQCGEAGAPSDDAPVVITKVTRVEDPIAVLDLTGEGVYAIEDLTAKDNPYEAITKALEQVPVEREMAEAQAVGEDQTDSQGAY